MFLTREVESLGKTNAGIKSENLPILELTQDNGSESRVISKADLDELKQVELDICDISKLANLNDFKVNMDDNFYLRATQYFDFVKNPYVFRVGDTGVKINFNGDKKLRDSIKNIVIKSSSH